MGIVSEHMGIGRLSRRGMLGMVAGGGALLFTTGLIGVSAAQAATKAIPGVEIRVHQLPNPDRRIIPARWIRLPDYAGRIAVTASDAGAYEVEVARPDLQRAVNALAAQEQAEAVANAATQRRVPGAAVAPPADPSRRLVIIRFSPGLSVTAPNGQVAVAGNPGVYLLSAGPQVFIVNNVAQGAEIAATIQTVDISDLVPAVDIAAATAGMAAQRGRGDIGAVLFGANSGYAGRMVPNPRAGLRMSRRR
jgi:hypothetical protein